MSLNSDILEREKSAMEKQRLENLLINKINNEEYNKIKWDLLAAEKVAQMFKDNGCGLSQEEQKTMSEINKEIKTLESQFMQNISNASYTIDLPNAPETTLTPMLHQKIMTSEPDENIRRAAAESKETVIEENIHVLKQLYKLRQKKARLLG